MKKKIAYIIRSMPYGTTALCAIIFVFSYDPVLSLFTNDAWGIQSALINDYGQTRSGEIWRLATSWVVHVDINHLAWDIAYLALVGFVIEKRHGLESLILVFLSSNILGALFSLMFDERYHASLGSSTGTHGLVAYFCLLGAIYEWHRRSVSFALPYVVVIAYLFYMSIYAIYTGKMSWPLESFQNGGYDHLGGLIASVTISILFLRRDIFYGKSSVDHGEMVQNGKRSKDDTASIQTVSQSETD